ncbi:MAG: GNAT family N-acetyltransferase [Pseudomonadota bacterium]
MSDQVLGTERLTLRPLRHADAGLIELYAGNARVARMTSSIPHPYPPGSAAAFIEKTLRSGALTWAIDHNGSSEGQIIGVIGLREDTEIGYWLGEPFWSTGFATEAVDAVIGEARRRGLPELRARVFQDNPASARVLTKVGFAYEAAGEVYSAARAAVVPDWRYRLVLS